MIIDLDIVGPLSPELPGECKKFYGSELLLYPTVFLPSPDVIYKSIVKIIIDKNKNICNWK